ncbi:hypothetical protein NOR_00748 [Metarhizium rileyi]|uniref:Uncharacterized protein n=1 Tax=Metarhizium rileyi (strain RCEF 4871) TaxID=1649241 RepID=A0A162JX37_METRR|nr:hypothetical protein NOR_00748 [Metarhizium rileyi RCEF 4871]
MEGKAAKHWDTLRNNVLKTNQERHTAMEEAACSVLSQKGVVGAETEEKPAQEEEAPEPKSLGTYQEVVGSMAEKEPAQEEEAPEPKSLGTYQEVVGSMAEKEPVQGESTPSQ